MWGTRTEKISHIGDLPTLPTTFPSFSLSLPILAVAVEGTLPATAIHPSTPLSGVCSKYSIEDWGVPRSWMSASTRKSRLKKPRQFVVGTHPRRQGLFNDRKTVEFVEKQKTLKWRARTVCGAYESVIRKRSNRPWMISAIRRRLPPRCRYQHSHIGGKSTNGVVNTPWHTKGARWGYPVDIDSD